MVAPFMTGFFDDLNKHDRKMLEENDHPFIYGYRQTGTNLFLMHPSMDDWFPTKRYKHLFGECENIETIERARQIMHEHLVWITYSNTNFLHFDGKKINTITKDQAIRIWTNYVDQLTFKDDRQKS